MKPNGAGGGCRVGCAQLYMRAYVSIYFAKLNAFGHTVTGRYETVPKVPKGFPRSWRRRALCGISIVRNILYTNGRASEWTGMEGVRYEPKKNALKKYE